MPTSSILSDWKPFSPSIFSYFIRSHAENGTLSAAFRGRGLEGCQLALPADYQLFVVKEKLNSAGKFRLFPPQNGII